ncbi:MAG: radical SAM protein [Deltaproteobacteria bacterium]|nr:radical SAM protein [Deltaproteobacteria bacterium]
MNRPPRFVRADEAGVAKPIYAVWELTLRCDQPCAHCGSRAGRARPDELSTDEARDVGTALARLGCREVTLIGGEAYLRRDLADIVRHLVSVGLRVTLQTGGRAFTPARAALLREAGVDAVGFSVDGPADVHDVLRGWEGSHAAAIRGMDAAVAAGFIVTANTQINRLNLDRLPETAGLLRAHGAIGWQVQLTVPLGRAADHPDWIVQPYEVPAILEALAGIQRKAAEEAPPGTPVFNVLAGNNIGYFGPHELVLRSSPGLDEEHWRGCRAGQELLGIESDGTIKACPSLPTASYAGGNVRDVSLEALWAGSDALAFTRNRTTDELWGFCGTCYYADICRAGCSFTAHATLGRRGNMPFCGHRATTLARRGVRERLVHREAAPGVPFDHGRFELVEEPLPEP